MACAPKVNERGQPIDRYGRTAENAAAYAEAVKRRELKAGMIEKEVRQVMGGKPEVVEKQTRNQREYVVWQYRKRSVDLFFDDDGYLMFWRAPY